MTEPIKLDEIPLDGAAFARAGDITVEGMTVYGPPRTRRGRFLNRLRRLLGLEERDEIYVSFASKLYPAVKSELLAAPDLDLDADVIRVRFGPDGILTFDDPDGEELEP